MRKELIIAVYLDDKFITVGTEQECSDQTGLPITTLRKYRTPAYWREFEEKKLEGTAENMTVVIVLDDED